MKSTIKAEIKKLAMQEYKKLKHNYVLKELNFEPLSIFQLARYLSVN